jgi:hypothetical protein
MKTEIENRIQDSGKQDATPGFGSSAISATPQCARPGARDQTNPSGNSKLSYGSRKSFVSAAVEDKMNSNQKTFEEKEGRVAAMPSFPVAKCSPWKAHVGLCRLKKIPHSCSLIPAIQPPGHSAPAIQFSMHPLFQAFQSLAQASSHLKQGHASLGKATPASKEKSSASLACKASALSPILTGPPFARKTLALLRFVARDSAIFTFMHF